jgi:plasmid stability protein
MTFTIDLPEEHAVALTARAAQEGISSEQYLRRVVEHNLIPGWLRESWASAVQHGTDQLSMEEIDAEIAAVRAQRRGAGTVGDS